VSQEEADERRRKEMKRRDEMEMRRIVAKGGSTHEDGGVHPAAGSLQVGDGL
jgi:hypothetical protein